MLDDGVVDLGWHRFPPGSQAWFAGLSGAEPEGECGVRLDWSPAIPSPATTPPLEYLMYRSSLPAGFDFDSPIGVVPHPSTSWTDPGASLGTTWYYVVRVRDKAGVTDSNRKVRSAEPVDRDPPQASLERLASPDACTVRLRAMVNDGCGGPVLVELHRSDVPGFTPDISTLRDQGEVTEFSDPVGSNGFYYYRIRARDQVGNERLSQPYAVRVDSCSGAIAPPGEVEALQVWRDRAADLWFELDAAEGAVAWRLYRGSLLSLQAAGYDHEASLGPDGVEDTPDDVGNCRIEATPFEDPAGGASGSFYYLSLGLDSDGREGLTGLDSTLTPRPSGGTGGTVLACN